MDKLNIAYTNIKIKEAFGAVTAADIPTSDESDVQTKLTNYASTLGDHTSQLAEITHYQGLQKRARCVVVAPSDAINKADADYVCDGTNDAQTIRNALHAVVGIGDGGEAFGWTHVQSTPVVPGLTFPLFWHDGTTFHAYGSYDSSTKIGHATSSDGITWTMDTEHNPVLTVGAGGAWDNALVAVFCPWQESDGAWKALYRGNGAKIGLATSADGVTWTKYASNPVIDEPATSCDPAGIIKAGSTYYLYANTTGTDREINVWTSTNLTAWTKANDSPAFMGGRYCSAPFKYDGLYYLIVSKQYEGGRGSCLELWKCADPFFDADKREFAGIVVYGKTWVSVDTPSVLTTNIERDTFYNGEFWCYYAKQATGYVASYPGYLVKEATVAAAIAKAVKPIGGEVIIAEGTVILFDEFSDNQSISLDYGVTLTGIGTKIKLADAFNRARTNRGVICVNNGCTLKGFEIDGNKDITPTKAMVLYVSQDGVAKDLRVKNCGVDMRVRGTIESSRFTACAKSSESILAMYGRSRLIACDVANNDATACIALRDRSAAHNCDVRRNTGTGINCIDDALVVDCTVRENVIGISSAGNARILDCTITYNTSRGIRPGSKSRYINCTIAYNTTGVKTLADGGMIIGGAIHSSTGFGIDATHKLLVDGVRIYNNTGYLNHGQVSLAAVCRLTNCIMEASTTVQQYQVEVTAAGTGSVIGNNQLKAGSIGYINLVGGATITEYNTEQIT